MTDGTQQDSLDFYGLGIDPKILKALEGLKLVSPTPIQFRAIPPAIEGKDLVGIAQTGTGKTFAFGIPMIQRLMKERKRGLVLLPTRELASQVADSLRPIVQQVGLKTAILIGGEGMGRQISELRRNPQIIIATPGRLVDHLERRNCSLGELGVLVLDEADRMFDMGFAPQINKILKMVPPKKQTLLFSATMPREVMDVAVKHMALPVRIEVAPSGTPAAGVDQEMIIIKKEDRLGQLEDILLEYPGSVLIFVRTKYNARNLCRKIVEMGHKASEIHSNRSLFQRREALAGFKNGRFRILVATDIAARGIDVNNIELVLNYDLPESSEDYVHRIGRTGRAGKAGRAVSFALPSQASNIRNIERLVRKSIPVKKLAEMQPEARIKHRYGSRRRSFSRPRRSR